MRVCHGLTGQCVEVEDQELQWRKPIEVIRQCAQDRWKVEPEDLIVLTSAGHALGPSAEAEELCRGKDVFLFFRSALDPKAEVVVEQLADEAHGEGALAGLGHYRRHEALSECHPAPSDDPAFEAFRRDILEAHRRIDEARPAAALAARVEDRVRVQRLAAQAVLDNLTSQRASCSRSMSLFLQKYERVQDKFNQNLGQVEVSMAALGSVRLHTSLRAEGRDSLADVVPRDRIMRFTTGLQEERARLAQRLEQLRQQDSQAQALCNQSSEAVRLLLEEGAVLEAAACIRHELARAESEILPALRGQVPPQGAAPDYVLEAERRSSEALAGLSQVCSGIRGLLVGLQSAWERQHAGFLQRLREVSYIQSKVRSVERQAALLEEELNLQRTHSQQLGHLQKMPKAYHKALSEVARRRQFRARYCAQAEQARSTLARMVEEENSRRRAFIHRYGCHLPADLIQGLGSLAPAATVEVASFDGQLPDIDLASLQEEVAEGEEEATEPPHASADCVSDSSSRQQQHCPADATGGRASDPPQGAVPPGGTETPMPASSSSASSSRLSPWSHSAYSARGAGSAGSSGGGLSGGTGGSSGSVQGPGGATTAAEPAPVGGAPEVGDSSATAHDVHGGGFAELFGRARADQGAAKPPTGAGPRPEGGPAIQELEAESTERPSAGIQSGQAETALDEAVAEAEAATAKPSAPACSGG